MGNVFELIFGLVLLGFILFMIIGIPMQLVSDSKKPKVRRNRYQKSRTTFASEYTLREFDYYHRGDKGEFFVYFIAN